MLYHFMESHKKLTASQKIYTDVTSELSLLAPRAELTTKTSC
jgi:hypothetical protein